MNEPLKSEPELPQTPTPTECAFSWTENSVDWTATVIWKCPACGRRNRVETKGQGKLSDSLPITVKCKLGHNTSVKPYRT
jgi:hypothetical protein